MRFTRRAAVAVVGVAALLAASACGGSDDGGGGTGSTRTSRSSPGGPTAARRPGWTAWSARSGPTAPDYEFVNGAVAGGAGANAKQVLASRLQQNDPPDTFQAHAGAELIDYINAGQIEDLSADYEELGSDATRSRRA